MNQPLFRKEAIDQQRERLHGDIILTQPLSFSLIIAFLLLITGIALIFLITNHYSKKEKVAGYLEPDKGMVADFAPQEGILTKIDVSEGLQVQEDDDLLTVLIDQRGLGGRYIGIQLIDELNTQEKILLKRKELERERASTEALRQEKSAKRFRKEIEQLGKSIEIHKEMMTVESEAYSRAQEVFSRDLVPRTQVENAHRRYLEQKQQSQVLAMGMEQALSNFDEIEINQRTLRINSEREIAGIESDISELSKQRATVEGRRQIVVKSPLSGRITSIVASVGQRLNPSVSIFSIIPEDSRLDAHLYIPTRAVGFLEVGQSVNIKYDAFPYQKFGTYSAKISEIAKGIISPREMPFSISLREPVYKVVAVLEKQNIDAYGKEIMLKPGMILSADVILAERSLFEWLLEPLYSLRGRL